MIIDISVVVKSIKNEMDLNLSVNEGELSDLMPLKDLQVKFISPMVFVGVLTNIEGVIKLSGEASVKYMTLCARCGIDISSEISFKVEEKLICEDDLEDDEMEEFFCFKGNSLDVGEILSEILCLNLPMREVCSKACKGRCIKCGVNLNKDVCACIDINDNSQFGALKDFFK